MENKGMGLDGITKKVANALMNVVQSWFAEFGNVLALIANQVVVLAMSYGFFVLSNAASELVFANQIAIDQKV